MNEIRTEGSCFGKFVPVKLKIIKQLEGLKSSFVREFQTLARVWDHANLKAQSIDRLY